MAISLTAKRMGLAFFAIAAFLSAVARAEERISTQHGIRIFVPAGFRDQRSDSGNTIGQFAESAPVGETDPITIHIRHTVGDFDPDADLLEVANLSRQEGYSYKSEARPWKGMDLQVVRQEIALTAKSSTVAYLVVFPLQTEGIILSVHGPVGREQHVLKVFNDSFHGFVNLVPLGHRSSQSATMSIAETLIKIVLSAVIGGCVILWVRKTRKAKAHAYQR